jgi:GNAT superfamily N-acetyltransferase
MQAHHILVSSEWFSARELGDRDIPALQQFFEDNPGYFDIANGFPVRDDEAQREFDDLPPPEMPFNRRYLIGFYDNDDKLIGMTDVLSDFLAPEVWQISFFIVATSLHGSGNTRAMYDQLENWIERNGAQWIRLGVIINNHKAERFWEKCGYTEIRKRLAVKFGSQIHDLRVMVKPFNYATLDEYLERVAWDRPESTTA